MKNITKNIRLEISFPFASIVNDNSADELFIYQKTIEEILKYDDENYFSLVSFYRNEATLYNEEIDDLLCQQFETNSQLDYPTIKFYYKDKKIDLFQDKSILIHLSLKKIVFNTLFETVSVTKDMMKNRFFNEPPAKIGVLTIQLYCDLQYIDCDDFERKFSFITNEDY